MAGYRAVPQRSTLIVGRQREQDQLHSLLCQTLDGASELALVSGEAGIGKSTLVNDLCRGAAETGCLVLTGGCYDLETTPPYGPWAEIIRAYPDEADLPDLPDELRVGGGMAGIESQAALFELATRFFAEVAAVRPTVLVLEDIHWADPSSLDFLRHLTRTSRGAPLLIAATLRDDEITNTHPLYLLLPVLVRESAATRIELQRLSVVEVAELVGSRYRLLPGDQERLVDYLMRRAEGNPFFIGELLHAIEERDVLEPVNGGWRLDDLTVIGVPSLVQQVIARRLSALDRLGRIILDSVAVAGQDVSLDLLEALHPDETGELDAVLQRAINHHLLLLQADGRNVQFTHALVRQTVYEAVPPLRRRSLHRQIGEQLEDRVRPNPARIAHHFHRAADERALAWLVRAAEAAQTAFAPESVLQLCQQVINLADELETEAPLQAYRLQGLALETIGDFDGALESHEIALSRARQQEDRRSEWRALLDLAALWASRDFARTGDYCRQAVDLARALDDPAALGHSLNRLGNWHINGELSLDGLACHEEALQAFESIGDLQGVASTTDLIASTYYMVGDPVAAIETFEKAIPLLREVEDLRTLSSALAGAAACGSGYIGLRNIWIPEFPESIGADPAAALKESLDLARSIGWSSGECFALGILGMHDGIRGKLRSGFNILHQSQSLAEEAEHRLWFSAGCLHLGLLYSGLGLNSRSLQQISAAADLHATMGSDHQVIQTAGHLAVASVREGRLQEAARLIEGRDVEAVPNGVAAHRICTYAAAELALAKGDHAAALRSIEVLLESLRPGPGHPPPEAIHLKGRILLALRRYDDAEEELTQALEIAEDLGLRLILWRIHASLRRLYINEGRLEDARRSEKAALEVIDALAGQIDAPDLRDEFLTVARAEAAPDLPFSSRGASPKVEGGLTPRELEVLRLVARGLTNEEASEQLFISPRTVDQHLRSIYGKLGVTNRTAASRIATEKNLL